MNTITIIGHVTADAELRHTQSGVAVAGFGVASNDGPKDKQRTVFFRVSLWRDYGEKLQPYLTKGTLVAVTGRFDSAPTVWTDKDGAARASLEVTGDRVRLLGGGQREQAPEAAPRDMADVDSVPF